MGCSDRDECPTIIVFLPIKIAQIAAGFYNGTQSRQERYENSLKKDILHYLGFKGQIYMPDKSILRYELPLDISYPVYYDYNIIRDFDGNVIIDLAEEGDPVDQFIKFCAMR